MDENSRESSVESRELNGSPIASEAASRPQFPPLDAPLSQEQSTIVSKVGDKEARRLKARSERNRSLWFGLGMFGVVGWSVAIPVLIGIAVGCWLDSIFHSHISWCLTFLFVGIVSGILIAWNWIKREGTPR